MQTRYLVKGTGWKGPAIPDMRDIKYSTPFSLLNLNNLPQAVDLRPLMPPVWDQLNFNSCTAHAVSDQLVFADKTNPYNPSKMYLWYNSRFIESSTGRNEGCYFRDVFKACKKYGFCKDETWPYNKPFNQKPSSNCYLEGRKELLIAYKSVQQNQQAIKSCLFQNQPVCFGMTLHNSFISEQAATAGLIPTPLINEPILGSHALLLVGFDNNLYGGVYIVKNSWGTSFGDKGYIYVPQEIIHSNNFCSDFWVIQQVT